jgi:hypothetical protein
LSTNTVTLVPVAPLTDEATEVPSCDDCMLSVLPWNWAAATTDPADKVTATSEALSPAWLATSPATMSATSLYSEVFAASVL